MERHGIARMRLVQPSGWWCVLLFLFLLFLFFFSSFFPLLSFFFLFFSLSPSSFLSLSLSLSHRLEPIFSSSPVAPSGSSLPVRKLLVLPSGLPSPLGSLPTATLSFLRSPRFVPFRSPLDFSAFPLPLLPLLNNCPPRGKTRRGFSGAILHHRRDRKMHRDASPVPRRKRGTSRILSRSEHFLTSYFLD